MFTCTSNELVLSSTMELFYGAFDLMISVTDMEQLLSGLDDELLTDM